MTMATGLGMFRVSECPLDLLSSLSSFGFSMYVRGRVLSEVRFLLSQSTCIVYLSCSRPCLDLGLRTCER